MRVLIVTQYYPPEPLHIPPTLAQGLAARGHEVRVVTGYPNYPAGELYQDFKQQFRRSERDGTVKVLRVPLWIDHSQSALKRTANYLSFALSSATTRRFAQGADVVYVYATQMTPALGPWLWRLTGGAPYVLHVQDLWPDSITGSSLVAPGIMTKIIDRLLNPWLGSLYRHASAVIGIAPTMVKTLVERGAPPDATHLVYNWDLADTSARPGHGRAHEPSTTGTTEVLYAGNVGVLQDLVSAIEAVHAARDSNVHLTIVGDGIALPAVRATAQRLGTTNVTFRRRVAREQMADLYATADFALVTLKDLAAFHGTIPSKVQASLAHSLPLITTVQGDVRSLVEDHRLGFTADAEDPASLAQALRSAARSTGDERLAMSARAWRMYGECFSPAIGISKIEDILRLVLADHGSAEPIEPRHDCW